MHRASRPADCWDQPRRSSRQRVHQWQGPQSWLVRISYAFSPPSLGRPTGTSWLRCYSYAPFRPSGSQGCWRDARRVTVRQPLKEAVMRRPSPSLAISCIALLVALGGTSYATVLQVPRNSVGTLQLQRNAVKAAKIAPNAIRTGHVLDGTLLTADFKPGQIPQGPKGDKGEKGDKGAPGTSGYEIVTATQNVVAGQSSNLTASCPAGKR